MFRIALSRLAATPATGRQRYFVSSVLLTRTWENESVADLKREAKIRGLSPRGNKASLILKIQEHDKSKTLDAIASQDPPVPAGVRVMSTASTASSEGVTPGIPPASQSIRPPPKVFMNTNIPDISQPNPELPIQIPYAPDFWDSSAPAKGPTAEEPLPKLLVVAGAETHPNGGPSHNLHDENAPAESVKVTIPETVPKRNGGLWDDVVEDLGLPPTRQLKDSFWKVFS